MTDVFLSYKAEDRPRLAPVVEALEAEGLSVWWDARIAGGDDWRETIERRLAAARCVIVAWSKGSVGPDGRFVRDEASRAQRRGAYLPIRIDRVDPPLGFGETQVLPLDKWNGDRSDPRFLAILEAVRARLGTKPKAPPETGRRRSVSRRAVVAGGAAAAAAIAGGGAWLLSRPATAASDSIAVLPFANLSGDPAQAYFSDGLAEEMRSALARVARLKVVARVSSEAVRDEDARSAARKLGVAHILTGSVRRSAGTIRIGAQLVDGRDGLERWSHVYDRSAGDTLQIQSEIAGQVAHALSIGLAGGRPAVAPGGTEDAGAHDLLLRANALTQSGSSEAAYRKALELLNAALSRDPRYARALAAKATLLNNFAGYFARSSVESRRLFDQAQQAASLAIALAPDAPEGHWALGSVHYYQLRLRPAFAQFAKARSISGRDAEHYSGLVNKLAEIRRSEAALSLADELVTLDPLNPQAYHAKAIALGYARRYPEAIAVERRAVALAPDHLWIRSRLGYLLMLAGQNAEARALFASLPAADGNRLTWSSVLAARTKNPAAARAGLEQLRSVAGDAVYVQQAQILAQLGDRPAALRALQQAWQMRDPGLTILLVDPLIDPLRNEPQFAALQRRLDFP